MKTPEREPTPEDLIEQEIYSQYHPMTMRQAIHNTIWYMRDKKHCTECNKLNDNLDCEAKDERNK